MIFYLSNSIISQEFINYNIIRNTSNNKNKASVILKLPFFDDFSTYTDISNSNLWQTNSVFVNSNYPFNPLSLGVATFDAIGNNGKIHSAASYGNIFSADTLTSNKINLNYSKDDKIFLSFYYQAQGLADAPETEDSLLLEFYDYNIEVWVNIWKTAGTTKHEFKQVMLPITDERFLNNEFRFRFRNYASLSDNSHPSLTSNVDHWHIDYVYLNKNRSPQETQLHDIAFTKHLQSLLKDYESMPWEHFKTNPSKFVNDKIKAYYRNNDNVNRLVDTLRFEFIDKTGNTENDTLNAGSYNVNAGKNILFNNNFDYPFTSNSVGSAIFEIRSVIVTDGFDSVFNNRMSYFQEFHNYYSYDDGSSEGGYGLIGEGTKNAMIAYKFVAEKEDKLQGIDMYFNRANEDANRKYFYLAVWKGDNNGLPGELLLKREGVRPEFEGQLNKFHTYILDEPITVSDTFYVGWVKTTTEILNIGFDINRAPDSKLFYNINGFWDKSTAEGALMIRPIFGEKIVGIKDVGTNNFDIKLYPNPVRDKLKIEFNKSIKNKKIDIKIINTLGTVVRYINNFNNDYIDLENLKSGIYILRIQTKNSVINKKIIKH